MRSSPAGLHLWHIILRNINMNLWITTHKQSAEIAARKAQDVLKRARRRDGWIGVVVDSIEYNGTIDA